MELGLGLVGDDVPGGGEAAVADDAADIPRQLFAGSHQHGGGTHGDSGQEGGGRAEAAVQIPQPADAVLPLQHAEADELPLAVPVGPLVRDQQVIAQGVIEGNEARQVLQHQGAVAVEEQDAALGGPLSREPPAVELEPVKAQQVHRLRLLLLVPCRATAQLRHVPAPAPLLLGKDLLQCGRSLAQTALAQAHHAYEKAKKNQNSQKIENDHSATPSMVKIRRRGSSCSAPAGT